jgi:anaerobic dimethyl sulfoxide reductase subunit C (anchor subunit)
MNIREWTLPVYTILTQTAIGSLFILWVIRTFWYTKYGAEKVGRIFKIPVLIVLITAIAGIIGAHFHLSKPYLSILALSNFHSSWLSREIVFDLCFIFFVGWLCMLQWVGKGQTKLRTILGWGAILFGFTTDFCMSRLYLLPSQPAWNTSLTPISFFETTLLLGVMSVPVLLIMDSKFSKSQGQVNQSFLNQIVFGSFKWLAAINIVLVLTVVALSFLQISILRAGNQSAQTSVELLLEIYQPLFIIRFVLLFFGGGILVYSVVLSQKTKKTVEDLMMHAFTACLMVMIAEILGRFLFFAIHVRIGI